MSGEYPDSRYIGCSEGIFQIICFTPFWSIFFVPPCSILDIGMTPMEPIAEWRQKEIVALELLTNPLVSCAHCSKPQFFVPKMNKLCIWYLNPIWQKILNNSIIWEFKNLSNLNFWTKIWLLEQCGCTYLNIYKYIWLTTCRWNVYKCKKCSYQSWKYRFYSNMWIWYSNQSRHRSRQTWSWISYWFNSWNLLHPWHWLWQLCLHL